MKMGQRVESGRTCMRRLSILRINLVFSMDPAPILCARPAIHFHIWLWNSTCYLDPVRREKRTAQDTAERGSAHGGTSSIIRSRHRKRGFIRRDRKSVV